MSETPGHDYDRVSYPSMAHPLTFAELLAVKGWLRGLDVTPPDRCRVLELGCGDGFNLAAMAACHPGAQYTGVDYSTEAVERGRRMLVELNLTQVRLETADIRQIDGLGLVEGGFDYIMAHGVYSWVPADVREALLAVIDRYLAPQGVAFVSYQALPGSYHREIMRTIMRFHTRAEKNPHEQVQQSRAILRVIAKGARIENHYTRWIADELESIESRPDEVLYHDELSTVSAPLLFTEFLAHAAMHRLQFLAEAEYLVPVSQGLTDEARATLKPLEANRVLLEQYLDFVEGRRFRQTLLCRPGLGAKLEHGRLDPLWVSCSARPSPAVATAQGEALEFLGAKNSRVSTTDPIEKAVMLTLTVNPGEVRPFPAVLAATATRMTGEGITLGSDFEEKVRRFICRAYMPGLVAFHWRQPAHASSVTARPYVHPIARWQLRQDTSPLLNYSGRFVEVKSDLGRHLLSLLDGTRDHAALAEALRDYLASRHEAARARGETVSLPALDDPALPEQLQHGLAGLAGLNLLRRD